MNVLVIEDDAAIRSNLKLWLTMEGFQVTAAEDGEQGIARAAEAAPQLVICDLLMPGIDGYAVLAALRAAPATRSVPFILLTASADKGEHERSLQEGVTVFMTKPFDLRALKEAIERCLKA